MNPANLLFSFHYDLCCFIFISIISKELLPLEYWSVFKCWSLALLTFRDDLYFLKAGIFLYRKREMFGPIWMGVDSTNQSISLISLLIDSIIDFCGSSSFSLTFYGSVCSLVYLSLLRSSLIIKERTKEIKAVAKVTYMTDLDLDYSASSNSIGSSSLSAYPSFVK